MNRKTKKERQSKRGRKDENKKLKRQRWQRQTTKKKTGKSKYGEWKKRNGKKKERRRVDKIDRIPSKRKVRGGKGRGQGRLPN